MTGLIMIGVMVGFVILGTMKIASRENRGDYSHIHHTPHTHDNSSFFGGDGGGGDGGGCD
ncbi:hypothetical protein [Halobacillus mangrovi]|uniref:hypothetical protein n=1 Tax=Halobacillus mangrovi TaxID=402384 RepID=UPI003D958697